MRQSGGIGDLSTTFEGLDERLKDAPSDLIQFAENEQKIRQLEEKIDSDSPGQNAVIQKRIDLLESFNKKIADPLIGIFTNASGQTEGPAKEILEPILQAIRPFLRDPFTKRQFDLNLPPLPEDTELLERRLNNDRVQFEGDPTGRELAQAPGSIDGLNSFSEAARHANEQLVRLNDTNAKYLLAKASFNEAAREAGDAVASENAAFAELNPELLESRDRHEALTGTLAGEQDQWESLGRAVEEGLPARKDDLAVVQAAAAPLREQNALLASERDERTLGVEALRAETGARQDAAIAAGAYGNALVASTEETNIFTQAQADATAQSEQLEKIGLNALEDSLGLLEDGLRGNIKGWKEWGAAILGVLSDALMAWLQFQESQQQGGLPGSHQGAGLFDFLGGLFGSGGFNIGSIFGSSGGGLLDGVGSLGLPASFAHGGSFRVGGAGGIDSQLVQFRATPGELVDVRTPGSARSGEGNSFTVNFNGPTDRDSVGLALPQLRRELGGMLRLANARDL